MMRRAASQCKDILRNALCLSNVHAERWLSSTAAVPQWVFLGPPGVGKGTYSKRMAKHIGVPHVSTGDLVRSEGEKGSRLGKEMQEIIAGGNLLPDEMILKLLDARLANERNGFILDGFPRTRSQAEQLSSHTDIHLVINLDLREEVLVQKCLGRRVCTKCGGDYNLADIHLAAEEGKREIIMPPLLPPKKECLQYMKMRDDDKEDVIKKRLQVYRAQAKPVEDFYRELGVLLDFEITGGIPETMPVLLQVLQKYFPTNVVEEKRKILAYGA